MVRAFVPAFCPSFFIWSSAVPNVRFVSAIREEMKQKDISKLPSIRDFGKTARLSLNFPSWEPPLRVCTSHLSDAFCEMLVGGVQNLMEEKGSTKRASIRDFEQVVTAVSFPFLHIQCAVRVLRCLLRCWSAQPQRDEKTGPHETAQHQGFEKLVRVFVGRYLTPLSASKSQSMCQICVCWDAGRRGLEGDEGQGRHRSLA
jgi:hypothetical protein